MNYAKKNENHRENSIQIHYSNNGEMNIYKDNQLYITPTGQLKMHYLCIIMKMTEGNFR